MSTRPQLPNSSAARASPAARRSAWHLHKGLWASYSPEDLFGHINLQDIFGADLFGDHGFGLGGNLFDRMFGRRAGPPRGADLEMVAEVPLERVLRGGPEPIRLTWLAQCASCKGTGAKAGTQPKTCDKCKGSGKEIRRQGRGGVVVQQISPCPACRGRGVVIDNPCPDCAGRGQAERTESLSVTIPAGIESGTALRVAGHGRPSDDPTGQPGDLFVIVETAPDPRFERRGADLWREEIVFVADAALGSTLTVPTLEGKAAVKIPPGTQPDAALGCAAKACRGSKDKAAETCSFAFGSRYPKSSAVRRRSFTSGYARSPQSRAKGRPIRRKRPLDIDEKGRIDDRDESLPQIDPAHIGLPDHGAEATCTRRIRPSLDLCPAHRPRARAQRGFGHPRKSADRGRDESGGVLPLADRNRC